MKDKNVTIKEYSIKVKTLKKHNNFYYNYDNPKISDADYDLLKKEIISLENEYDYLKSLNLTKNLIGSKPLNKFKKIKHLIPMLSLSNAFDLEDMKDFDKKVKNFLSKEDQIELFSEPKIDGISELWFTRMGL